MIITSQSRFLESGLWVSVGSMKDWEGGQAYCCLKVCSRSQTMMGRLRRSL
jgi:hypothetical protein